MGKAGKAVEAQRPATARSGAPQSRKGSGIGPKEELPEELWPFPAPKLTELGQFQGTHAERLLWGTYRPGFYFGMRMRVPRSVVVGLMWLDPSKSFLDSIRHEAQQSDGLERSGWLQHDGETFGVQELLDGGLALTTSWAKRLCEGCGQGGDWGARVMADVRAAGGGPDQAAEQPQAAPARVTLFVYVATEDDSALQLDPAAVAAALERPAAAGEPRPAARGRHAALGPWALYLSPGADPSSPRPTRVSYWGARAAHTHNLTQGVKDAILHHYYQQHAQGVQDKVLTLPNEAARRPSLAVFQIDTLTPAALDVSFLSGPGSGGRGDGSGGAGGGARAAAPRHAAVAGRGLDQLLERRAAAFERRFADTFGPALRKGGGDGAQQPGQEGELPEGTAEVAKAALANMLGGMGYWHGSSLVRLPQPPPGAPRRRRQGQQQAGQQGGQEQPEAAELWPAPLYSAVPSRSFFPRGFLWDEGFHQLLIRRRAAAPAPLPASSSPCVAGGRKARCAVGVPSEFVVQSPSAANPPTFFLVLADMSRQVVAATQAAQASGGSGSTVWDETTRADAEFLVAAWPRLVTWYRWFNTSQAGQEPGAYRWRGRVADSSRELNPKTLTSGLDDYPRASHPTGKGGQGRHDERHVDLRCWMALASRALATIGSNLGLPQEEVALFEETALRLESLEELNRLHWDAESGQYRDWGLHTEGASLQQEQFTRPDGSVQLGEWRRVVNEAPARRLVPQFGYVSLFPLLMRLLPAGSAELGRQLELLRDPGLLWTPYGLRSLAASASLYQARNTEHDPPYWRGAIWINVNLMAVQARALRHYAAQPGPHQGAAAELHAALREALLSNLVGQYQSSGFLWEQYDDASGAGKGSHPFTGWTGLLALLAAAD
eukprot:scaffold4.g4738.t1